MNQLTDSFFQKTFYYNSKLWSNKVDFNLPGGKTGLDTHETKLPTYWNTPFNKICLGMKIGQELKSVVINHQARSLYSLIADGKYRATSLGRNTWKKLIGSRASLQPNYLMTIARVETKLLTVEIMATSTSKRWDISWFNKCCNLQRNYL